MKKRSGVVVVEGYIDLEKEEVMAKKGKSVPLKKGSKQRTLKSRIIIWLQKLEK